MQAVELDRRLQQGEELGLLAGVPVAVKVSPRHLLALLLHSTAFPSITQQNQGQILANTCIPQDNICTRGVQTTAGSLVLRGYLPPYDATAVARLRAAGAVIIGKTNMDEFGMGSSTENSAYAPTRNPWDMERVPGGSSGGSAAAVAAGQCVAALGTDTGGSIRQPAHFCGVVGVKPTYGRVSRYGLIAYASSLDCIGPMASSVADAAQLLGVMAGPDPLDATCSRMGQQADRSGRGDEFSAGLLPAQQLASRPLEGRRVGLILETTGEGVHAGVLGAVYAALQHLQDLGAVVEEVRGLWWLTVPTLPPRRPAC
jgi:aspartyl-tRNA(Asn)/glutamyl-tRNA(Gln) amidotransferase subunit A